MNPELRAGDALLVVDAQRDFVHGSLPVADAAAIVPLLNRYVREFGRRGLPVVATRDWHPPDHCSFLSHGGRWPSHCVAGSAGAEFAAGLGLGPGATIVSKATGRERDAYSGFDATTLDATLRGLGVKRLFIGGLATDYCVLETVKDARRLGYAVVLLCDAIRAVDARPGDGVRAQGEMLRAGALPLRLQDIESAQAIHG
ncbi:MAG: isochorismatase family protein [Usitatibacter sp.]